MKNWFHIFPQHTGLSLYAWIIFCLLPFYFVIANSAPREIVAGVLMIIIFFAAYRFSFVKRGSIVYAAVGIELAVSIGMTLYFGYIYFFLFLAFFIGNITQRREFVLLYTLNVVAGVSSAAFGFYIQSEIFMMQLPFIVISLIGILLLPFTIYLRKKQEKLEGELKDANKKISQLIVMEERQRIARDLHDTLGQKLSLIGLKSDLAEKLIEINGQEAKKEIGDINRTARLALKEVRELVSDMRGTRLAEEMRHVQEILEIAGIHLHVSGSPELKEVPLLAENTLSMCLKEAVTNIVKHSKATLCEISILDSAGEILVKVTDNGSGFSLHTVQQNESGIQGMKERLEFVNGTLDIVSNDGTSLFMRIPRIVQPVRKEQPL
ncbi:histidine kinase [Bacillus daqingensis]|uniref:histidine kinase n=1 Tax=Bacillus daqingensis TaxID=872396 RepID=A0ABV9NW58_9BACI